MTTTFETARVGDKVWSIERGWGEILSLTEGVIYPVEVGFPNEFPLSYTLGGKLLITHEHRTLFWSEIVIDAPAKPTPALQVDAKILVWDVPEVKHNRHFSHFDAHGFIHTFTDGKTSFTSRATEVSKWLDWDLAE